MTRTHIRTGRTAGIGRRALLGLTVGALGASLFAAPLAAQREPGGPVPTLNMTIPNWPDFIEIARLVKPMWEQLGVKVEVRQTTMESFIAQIISEHKMPHVAGISWGGAPDRLDPDYFLTELNHSAKAKPGGLNYGEFSNADYDKLVDAQRAEMDPAKRLELVKKAQAILHDQVPSIVLYHINAIQAYNKQRWTDVVPVVGNGVAFPYIPWTYYKAKPLTRNAVAKVTSIYDIHTLNPFATFEIHNSTLLRWMYPTLVIRDEKLEVKPWAAESWTVVDPTTIDVTIRDGMKFHDGKPVTIEDAKFTFDYMLKWKFPAYGRVVDTVDSVTVTGPRTMRIALKRAFAPFVPNVLGFVYIAPKHIWEAIPGDTGVKSPADWPNAKPVGYGPFKFAEWRKSEYLHLKASDGFHLKPNMTDVFWLAVPSIDNQIGLVERGDADFFGWRLDPTQADRVKAVPHMEVVSTPTHGAHDLRLNTKMAPTDDVEFRRALRLATDRKRMMQVVAGGAAIAGNDTFIVPTSPWANTDLVSPEASIEKARDVLKAAGYSWDKDGRLLYPK